MQIIQSTFSKGTFRRFMEMFVIPWKMIKNNGIIYVLEEYLKTSETYLLKSQSPSVIFPGLYTLKLEFVGHLTEDSAKNFFRNFYTNKENGSA